MAITQREKKNNYEQVAGLLHNKTYHEELPVVMLQPAHPNKRAIIWITDTGKAGLYTTEKKASVDLLPSVQLLPEIESLLKQGFTVVGVDLMLQGEFLSGAPTPELTRRVGNTRESAAYTLGYNHSLFAQRTHDILTTIQYLRTSANAFQSVDLVGVAGSGPWVAAAKAQAGKAIRRTVVHTGGFRFGKVMNIHDLQFLPGGAKYGDLPGFLALAAPDPLWVCGESRNVPMLEKVYQLATTPENLQIHKDLQIKEILTWLTM
jgi:hypothetical protein